MLERIAMWFLNLLLSFLYNKAKDAAGKAIERADTAKRRQESDEIHIQAYDQAKDRKSKIEASINLLNSSSPR